MSDLVNIRRPPEAFPTKYDGSGKFWTRDCSGCAHRAKPAQRSRLSTVFRPAMKLRKADGLCLWGRHLVGLFKDARPKQRRCPLILRAPAPGANRWRAVLEFAARMKRALL